MRFVGSNAYSLISCLRNFCFFVTISRGEMLVFPTLADAHAPGPIQFEASSRT